MIESIAIAKSKNLVPSQDYPFLRKAGISLIQQLAGKLWTDFNIHDPGVAMHEMLCFAITDLGYRSDFNIRHLLAHDPKLKTAPPKNFFTAAEILTCNPLTIYDYRKLLIDVGGVKNAWLEPTEDSEITFYVDRTDSELTYSAANHEKILLNGLYKILLEFEEDRQLGDLNSETIEWKIVDKNTEVIIEADFDGWAKWEKENKTAWINAVITGVTINNLFWNPTQEWFTAEAAIKYKQRTQAFNFHVRIISNKSELTTDELKDLLKKEILRFDAQSLLVFYQQKISKIFKIIADVRVTLHAHRNLCEDFRTIESPKVEEVVLCADIELAADADVEEVLAQIYFLVGKFVAPPVNFYTIKEMMNDKNKTIDEIFEGPSLLHGFIDENELKISDRRKVIHLSDIINIIMDVPGVVALRSIELGSYLQGADAITNQPDKWSLKLAYEENYIPRLDIDKSKFLFYKGQIPYTANYEQMKELLAELKLKDRAPKLAEPQIDLPIPHGEFMEVQQYSSIQNDFPLNYGIGEIGLPDSASPLRKAQAKQLKAYLLFFEQLLANYFAQLAHVGDLFSTDKNITRTYFTQVLQDVPLSDELYTPDFLTSPQLKLDEIAEDKKLFEERRNHFLDHLMARFCEQFTDYSLIMYSYYGKKAPEKLIEDKLALLQNYPEISRDRGKAFNYKDEKNVWDTDNVSGLEKRVCRLLGIDNFNRRFLTCKPQDHFEIYKDRQGKWHFRVKDGEGNYVLAKSEGYNSLQGCKKGIESVIKNFQDSKQYQLKKDRRGNYYFNLVAKNGEIIATSNFYPSEEKRKEAIDTLVSLLKGGCDSEGLHIIEHLLLRPKVNEKIGSKQAKDNFLPVFLDDPECGNCPYSEDPYSCRISVIVPYWPRRFRNLPFRRHFERTVRLETPAHLALKICWVNEEQMKRFEKAYKEWLAENAKEQLDKIKLSAKLNKLIKTLEELRSVYPVATLHDCEENTGDAPVVLDNTILGTFKPEENE